MNKNLNLRMILYELRNINGNFMPHFFGIIFPNLMSLLLSKTVGGQMPAQMRQSMVTSIMLTTSMIIPMAIMLLGYGCLYSIEVERTIPLRMHLFGISARTEIIAKITAHLIFLTLAFIIFAVFHIVIMDVQAPAVSSLLCLILCLYCIGIILLVIAHAITNLLQKFSLTFGVTMFLYFGFMILTGMMGIETSQLPKALQAVARTLPMTYISNDFAEFWQGGSYNFIPLIQSFLFFGASAGILLLLSLYKNRRTVGSLEHY
ncbi:MAG: ABC transporter permease [Lachnospiraceae bacterium]|nr:ABC transporter permease [Lachnospiraceae bacterium]